MVTAKQGKQIAEKWTAKRDDLATVRQESESRLEVCEEDTAGRQQSVDGVKSSLLFRLRETDLHIRGVELKTEMDNNTAVRIFLRCL
jgi:hypothetical protein